ncbi:hypothetical protein Tco_0241431 [Tanacetum coccineum]
MRTRSQTRNLNRQQQAPPAVVEPFNLEELFNNPTLVQWADNDYGELLQAPTDAGGNFLDKMPRECLKIIESKSKVRNPRNKAVVAKVSSNSSTPRISPDVAALTTEVSELKNVMKTMLIDKQKAQAPVPVKAVEQSCVTCGGVSKTDFENYVKANDAILRNMQNQGQGLQNQMTNFTRKCSSKFIIPIPASTSVRFSSKYTPLLTKGRLEGIFTEIGNAYQGPRFPTTSSLQVVERRTENRRKNANEQIEKFYEIFKDMSFKISLMDALTLMPKFASTLKALFGNKEKLSEMARTPLNEHYSAVILNKLPEKLGRPQQFLMHVNFSEGRVLKPWSRSWR